MFLVVIIVVVAAAVVVHRRGRRELGCWLCSWCCSGVGGSQGCWGTCGWLGILNMLCYVGGLGGGIWCSCGFRGV